MAKLAKLFKCTVKFVYMALTYRTDTEKAKKIRYVAVKDYAAKPMSHCPECETMHNVTEGGRQLMVQNFDNGVRLEIDKQTGATVVYEWKSRRNHVRCGQLGFPRCQRRRGDLAWKP